jgi:glutamine synthetase
VRATAARPRASGSDAADPSTVAHFSSPPNRCCSSKTRTLYELPKTPADLPIWNFDGEGALAKFDFLVEKGPHLRTLTPSPPPAGSSTGQAPGTDSEVLLRPVRIFPDPFRGAPNLLVMCETIAPNMEPIPTNTRSNAAAIFTHKKELVPWFGLEQEYTLFNADKRTPLGWPTGGFPAAQGPYYCSVGADNAFGRPIVEAHYRACLFAGIRISGINGEVLPGQWEYQVGPVEGIDSGDQVWMARFLMYRVCEDFGVHVSFDPKPISGDWNGSGMHTNFSTEPMRVDGGYKVIIDAIEKLGRRHKEHIAVYGEGNERRLTGKHETANMNTFLYGVANRAASIRIPRDAEREGKGYFEDRRPASNCDPYVVTSAIFQTCCL